MKLKSRVKLQLSKGRSCVKCDKQDGTIIPAHYNGIYKFKLGGGAGLKVWDEATADLCQECHDAMDGRTNELKDWLDIRKSDLFLILIQETIERDINLENLVSTKEFRDLHVGLIFWYGVLVANCGILGLIKAIHHEVQKGNLIYKKAT